MTDFSEYLRTLARTPLTEAVYALYEGYTEADMKLNRYLASLNVNVKIPKPLSNLDKPTLHRYVIMARHAKDLATILKSAPRVIEASDDEFGSIATFSIMKNILHNLGISREDILESSASRISHIFSSLGDTTGIVAAADMYESGDIAHGFEKLRDVMGDDLFTNFSNCLKRMWRLHTPKEQATMTASPDPRQRYVLNKWLVHGTTAESAVNIALNGFDRGNKIGMLAYNESAPIDGNKHDYTGDYLFAFDAEDDEKMTSYGTSLILFKANGYKIYHSGDHENQVVFDYHQPTGCFLVLEQEDAPSLGMPLPVKDELGYYRDFELLGMSKSNKPTILYTSDSVYDCINWVLRNGDSYTSRMFKWK